MTITACEPVLRIKLQMHNYFGKQKSSFITYNLFLKTIFDSQTVINKNLKLNNYASTGFQTLKEVKRHTLNQKYILL